MVLGTSRDSDADMSVTQGSPRAKTGVLPIAAMLHVDRLQFLQTVCKRLQKTGAASPSRSQLRKQNSVLDTLLQYIGPNWRMLEWLFTFLGGGTLEAK